MSERETAGRLEREPRDHGDTDSPGDRAWQNDLTEEDMPSPEEREDESADLQLDPVDEDSR
ncbi:MAG TPA: hypothetical protein VKG44_00580 [Candidatus Baltobacteraceae bacterium]|nr:hypothetical protein [Candidatus Baltobacteraceae bacterium]